MSGHEILFTEQEIQQRVREIGAEISRDYAGKEVILVGLLKGAAYFLVDLSRSIEALGRVTACRIEFMGVESYGNGRMPGDVHIYLDVRRSLRKKHVILVDDVADTRFTLRTVTRFIKSAKRPKTLRTCVLLDKSECCQTEVPLHYVGFSGEGFGFVYGSGMDLEGASRGVSNIARAPAETAVA
ncbi:MAG: phosphoribosyltransferase family protein [bacterium]|nr:phosphoribosyltransferase family protein [bacterium]